MHYICFVKGATDSGPLNERNTFNNITCNLLIAILAGGALATLILLLGFVPLLFGSIITGDIFNGSICDSCSFGFLLGKGYKFLAVWILCVVCTSLFFMPVFVLLNLYVFKDFSEEKRIKTCIEISIFAAIFSIYWIPLTGAIPYPWKLNDCSIETYTKLMSVECVVAGALLSSFCTMLYWAIGFLVGIIWSIRGCIVNAVVEYSEYFSLVN